MISPLVFEAYGMPVPDDLKRFGSGLIHDTFLFSAGDHSFLLQRLNQAVFKDLDGIMHNIGLVSMHTGQYFPGKTFIQFVLSLAGEYLVYVNQDAWRMMRFIPDSISYDIVQHPMQAYEAGRIIGDFHAMFSNFDASRLTETIPGFHDFKSRFHTFIRIQEADAFQRSVLCRQEIAALLRLGQYVNEIEQNLSLPLRVTHNDTKLNNILFDLQGHSLCMVDLDTVMPGKITFDTGDALRTMCNPAGEDGSEGEVTFSEEIFTAFSKGFIESGINNLKKEEINALPFSAIRMATEQALRFLSDYLDGDRYYKQPYPGFNLQATQAQIKLIHHIEQRHDWMEDQVGVLLDQSR